MTESGTESAVRRFRAGGWGRRLLILGVVAYLAWLIGLPLAGILKGAFGRGSGPFIAALVRPDVLHAFGVTLAMSAGAVSINAFFGLIVAWVLVHHRHRGQRLMNAIIDLPFAVSPVVAGYMILLLFGRSGWFRGASEAAGFQVAFAWPGILLATTFVSLPFVIRSVAPVLSAMGEESFEAARTLGASPWQIFLRVTLPAIKWGLLYGMTLTLERTLGEFGAVFIVGGAVVGATETATIAVFRSMDERQYLAAYAISTVLIGIALAVLAAMEILRRETRIPEEIE